MGTLLVGVTCCIDRGKKLRVGRDYQYVNRAYAQMLAQAGATPALFGLDAAPRKIVAMCAGLVITGGDNLPRTFAPKTGDVTSPGTLSEAEDPERVKWERGLLDAFQDAKKPVLGVCYGMQLMNLHLGGTLMLNLEGEHAGALAHGGAGVVTTHITEQCSSSKVLAGLPPKFETNSSHGQAVAEVASRFTVTALAEDGIVEAIEGPGLYGLEWHPETDATGTVVYRNFVQLCGP